MREKQAKQKCAREHLQIKLDETLTADWLAESQPGHKQSRKPNKTLTRFSEGTKHLGKVTTQNYNNEKNKLTASTKQDT